LFRTCLCQQLADRPDKLSVLLRENTKDIKALGDMAMSLLAPVPERISDQVLSYMESHYTAQLTLNSVAAALGYNATYLGRVFREEMKTGFRDWLNDMRIQKAAEMLKGSSLPVHQIADKVGYAQYKRFLAQFKQFYGQTPQEYRRKLNP